MTFDEKVYNAVKQIPYGRVATYGRIAAMCGNVHSARAVGNALHNNLKPEIIPCYRVVNCKGKLAEHFAFGGIEGQERYLRAEGVEVNNGRVDLKKYQWHNE
ncbi:MAG: MGMT family protein [Eubacterium sp.]